MTVAAVRRDDDVGLHGFEYTRDRGRDIVDRGGRERSRLEVAVHARVAPPEDLDARTSELGHGRAQLSLAYRAELGPLDTRPRRGLAELTTGRARDHDL